MDTGEGGGISKIPSRAGGRAVVSKGIGVEAGEALGEAAAVGVGIGASRALDDAGHRDIVDEAINWAGRDTSPVIRLILAIVASGADIYANLPIGVIVDEKLLSVYAGALSRTPPSNRIPVLARWAIL